MLKNGYTFSSGEDYGRLQVEKERFHHVELQKDGIVFELHKVMSEKIQNKQSNQIVQKLIEEGLDHVETDVAEGYSFPRFSKGLNGLIILRHIVQHLGEDAGIGLRQILDWMKAIMRMGNFGTKSKKEDEGVNVFYKNKNIFSLLKSLQRLGLSHWSATTKYPILRPFAWIYQIGHYFRKTFSRKHPIKSLRKDLRQSRNKKEMLERLDIDGRETKKYN